MSNCQGHGAGRGSRTQLRGCRGAFSLLCAAARPPRSRRDGAVGKGPDSGAAPRRFKPRARRSPPRPARG